MTAAEIRGRRNAYDFMANVMYDRWMRSANESPEMWNRCHAYYRYLCDEALRLREMEARR